MPDTRRDNIVVLTQCGVLPTPDDFKVDPVGATERLHLETLRIQAEALTCLSLALGRSVGDCDFDDSRLAALVVRMAKLRDLVALAFPLSVGAAPGPAADPARAMDSTPP